MRLSIVSAIVLVVGSVTGVTAATGTVAADSDTVLGEVLDGPDADESATSWIESGASATWAAAGGAKDRATWWFSSNLPESLSSDPPTASEEADATSSYYNANNATLEAYASDRNNWTSNQTVEITWHLQDTTETRYLVATASNGNLTNSSMVANTSRTADHSVDLCGFAAEKSQEELETFVKEYAEPGKDVDTEYRARLKGRYNKDVETTLYPTNGDCGGDA